MAISKIQKTSVSDEVYNQILEAIRNGDWTAGSKLPAEVELAEMFGVSRISVRNAIQRLVGQGVLVSIHGEGTFVGDLSFCSMFEKMTPLLGFGNKEEVMQMYEFRSIFETGVIRLLSKKGLSKETLDSLELNYENMKNCKDSMERFVQLDIEFHSIMVEAADNMVIKKTYSLIREALYPMQLAVQTTFGTRGAIKYHKLIMDMLKAGDFEKAENYMQEHMEMAIKNVATEKQNII